MGTNLPSRFKILAKNSTYDVAFTFSKYLTGDSTGMLDELKRIDLIIDPRNIRIDPNSINDFLSWSCLFRKDDYHCYSVWRSDNIILFDSNYQCK